MPFSNLNSISYTESYQSTQQPIDPNITNFQPIKMETAAFSHVKYICCAIFPSHQKTNFQLNWNGNFSMIAINFFFFFHIFNLISFLIVWFFFSTIYFQISPKRQQKSQNGRQRENDFWTENCIKLKIATRYRWV